MGIAQQVCKGCSVKITGATSVQVLEQHGGYCRDCRGDPYGQDRYNRRDEKCQTCGKTWRDH